VDRAIYFTYFNYFIYCTYSSHFVPGEIFAGYCERRTGEKIR